MGSGFGVCCWNVTLGIFSIRVSGVGWGSWLGWFPFVLGMRGLAFFDPGVGRRVTVWAQGIAFVPGI